MMEKDSPQRLNYYAAAPRAVGSLMVAGRYIATTSLEPGLIHLVNMRASQINGCAFCIALHTIEAEADGERSERLHGLLAWRESSWYTPRERAAIEWTEALTLIARAHVSDELYARMLESFSETELVDLTLAVTTINAWNRFAISFHAAPEDARATFDQLQAAKRDPGSA